MDHAMALFGYSAYFLVTIYIKETYAVAAGYWCNRQRISNFRRIKGVWVYIAMLDFIHEIIKTSGSILLDYSHKSLDVSKKGQNDYVTAADLAVEEYLKKIIHEKFPTHNIIAEETDHLDQNSEYSWYIDPLSSTDNFVHGMPKFGTAIAVMKGGNVLAGASYDPSGDELFSAEKGKGSMLNGRKIIVSQVTDLKRAFVFFDAGTRSYHEMEMGYEYYGKIYNKVNGLRRIGSVALEMSYVACGRADAGIYAYIDKYSFPAGKIIVEEAGGKMSNSEGIEWNENVKNTIVSNNLIHKEIIECLTK